MIGEYKLGLTIGQIEFILTYHWSLVLYDVIFKGTISYFKLFRKICRIKFTLNSQNDGQRKDKIDYGVASKQKIKFKICFSLTFEITKKMKV